ncbi:MAG: TonB-dependent receptor [SAR324 cluster bacterium]|nr:TonB-dependent receptor [SAR324 cluster bacterium]
MTFRIHIFYAVLVCWCLFFGLLAHAEDISEEEGFHFDDSLEDLLSTELVTITSRQAQTVDEVPNIVTIITEEDIRSSGAQTLGEILQYVPGIQVRRGNAFEFEAGYPGEVMTMRGVILGDNRPVLIMINGHRINSVQTGGTNDVFPFIPLQQVRRIEIIRGPGAARYGTGAFSGVVNIITREGGDLRGVESTTTFTNHEGFTQSLTVGNKQGNWEYLFHGMYKAEKGQNHRLDKTFGGSENVYDGIQMDDASVSLKFKRFFFKYQQSHYENDPFTIFKNPALDDDPQLFARGRSSLSSLEYEVPLKQGSILFDLQYSRFTSALVGPVLESRSLATLASQAVPEEYQDSFYNLFLELFPKGMLYGTYSRENRLAGNVQWTQKVGEHHVLDAGINLIQETIEENGFIRNFIETPEFSPLPVASLHYQTGLKDKSRTIEGVYFQDNMRITSWLSMYLGARYDEYSDFGHTFNPRGGLVLRLTDQQVVKLLYGSAFRAPSFVERFSFQPFPLVITENELKPETVHTWEGAYHYGISQSYKFKLNAYQSRIENIIIPGDGGTKNGAASNIQGLETEFKAEFRPQHSLTLNTTKLYSQIMAHEDNGITTNLENLLISQDMLNLIYRVPLTQSLHFNTSWLYRGPQKISMIGKTFMDAYTVGNAQWTLYSQGAFKWETFLGIQNLTNIHYEYPVIESQEEFGATVGMFPKNRENHIPAREREYRLGFLLHF